MPAPRLAEASDEQIVVSVEEEQARAVGTYHIVDGSAGIAEAFVAAYVESDSNVGHARRLESADRRDENAGRKVLDTVKAEIFERLNCLTLAGTRRAGDEHYTRRTHMKLFSPERANALLHKLAPLIDELLAKRRDLAIKLLESDPALHHAVEQPQAPRLAGVRSPFPPPRFGERKLEIHRLIHRIEALGCIVKDIDLGLIDFPATRDGEPVYLCWKAGEPAVGYWHGTDEGFASRKPLDAG